MRFAVFLGLLVLVVAVFAQSKSVKSSKQYRKTKSGNCVEHKAREGSRRSSIRLYTDKECKIPKKSGSSSRKLALARGQKSAKRRVHSRRNKAATNSTLVKRAGKKSIQKPKTVAKVQKAAKAVKTNIIRSRSADKKNPAAAKTQKAASSSSTTKSWWFPFKRPVTVKAVQKSTKKPIKYVKKKPGKVSTRMGKQTKQSKSTDVKLPVAVEIKSVCYVTYSNGNTFSLKKGCEAIEKAHYRLIPGIGCYQVMKDKKNTTKLVGLLYCDRPKKFWRFVLEKNKCVLKFFQTKPDNRFSSFSKKSDCEMKGKAKVPKWKKKTKNDEVTPPAVQQNNRATTAAPATAEPREILADIPGDQYETEKPDSGETEETDPDETEEETDPDETEEDTEEEPDEINEPSEPVETPRAPPRPLPPFAPKPTCYMQHGRYSGKCLDMNKFYLYAEEIQLNDPSLIDWGKMLDLGNHVLNKMIEQKSLNMKGIFHIFNEASMAAQSGKYHPLASVTSLTAKMSGSEFCTLVSKFNVINDRDLGKFVTPCQTPLLQ